MVGQILDIRQVIYHKEIRYCGELLKEVVQIQYVVEGPWDPWAKKKLNTEVDIFLNRTVAQQLLEQLTTTFSK